MTLGEIQRTGLHGHGRRQLGGVLDDRRTYYFLPGEPPAAEATPVSFELPLPDLEPRGLRLATAAAERGTRKSSPFSRPPGARGPEVAMSEVHGFTWNKLASLFGVSRPDDVGLTPTLLVAEAGGPIRRGAMTNCLHPFPCRQFVIAASSPTAGWWRRSMGSSPSACSVCLPCPSPTSHAEPGKAGKLGHQAGSRSG